MRGLDMCQREWRHQGDFIEEPAADTCYGCITKKQDKFSLHFGIGSIDTKFFCLVRKAKMPGLRKKNPCNSMISISN